MVTGWEKFFLGICGFSGGILVAGGVVALVVSLGIIRRFAGITHTAVYAAWYETAICLGGIWGCVMTVYFPRLPFGMVGLALLGIFFGTFVGGWIIALAELISVFPVFARRLGLTRGKSWMVVGLALGKTLGSLLQFYLRWGK